MAVAVSSSHKVVREGFLFKRQRGKNVVIESNRKKLKFEERYCILTSTEFTYKKKEKTATKGTLPVENIKVVEQVKAETFSKQKCDFCFQVGEQNNMIYLVAKDAIEMIMWMNDFRKVAKQNHNVMSEFYHPGAYGSIRKGKWSCCRHAEVTAKGCKPCGSDKNETDSLASSDIKPKMSHSFPRSLPDKKYFPTFDWSAVATSSNESDCIADYTSGDDLLSQHSELAGDEMSLDSPIMEISLRRDTGTSKFESGIDTDHGSRLNSNASRRSEKRRHVPDNIAELAENEDKSAEISHQIAGKSRPLCDLCSSATTEDILICERCTATMHRNCAGVTKQQYDQLVANTQPFLCSLCTQNLVQSLEAKVATLESELANLNRESLSPITSSSCSLESNLQTVKEDMEMVKSKIATNTSLANEHRRAKIAVPGKRKIWGTLKICTPSTVKHAITKFTSILESDIEIKRKYDVNSDSQTIKWWHVISSDEQTMLKLEEEWEKVQIQTSWSLTQCLSYEAENDDVQ